jgi:group II intron reverse transcriptase/maturase
MMNGPGKSDRPIVPKKGPNKAERSVAEALEGRGLAKGNASQLTTSRTQGRIQDVPEGLARVRQAARRSRKVQFTALLHHVTVDRLRESFQRLNRRAAPGVDGVTWAEYVADLESNLETLHERIHGGAYRAKASRRSYIPKADGRQRPLGIATLEDKVVQGALVEVLNAIYETDFLGFSYGFRQGRGTHDALDALATALLRKKVSWVLDADIRGFFDAIPHEWLMQLVGRRVGDRRVLRLIRKWLNAGVLEAGELTRAKDGTPQGATISPLLANVYLHYALDVWVHDWRKRYARGEVVIVRYADDFVVGFQHRTDAERFRKRLEVRMRRFGLTLHPEKTRLIEFGRNAAENRRAKGEGKPETFDFLGFTHVCATTRRGRFALHRRTKRAKMQATLTRLTSELKRRMHWRIAKQGEWLARVVQGWQQYYAVPTNIQALYRFQRRLTRIWYRTLRRRGQRRPITWARVERYAERWFPPIRILHPWPDARFARHHPRQEPSAVTPLAGICAGGAP